MTWAKQNPDTLAELGRAREDACDISTSYGKLLQEMTLRGKTGHEIKVAYLAPAAMLQHAASCARFGCRKSPPVCGDPKRLSFTLMKFPQATNLSTPTGGNSRWSMNWVLFA